MNTNLFRLQSTRLVLKYANPTSRSNTIYNIKYKIVDREDLRDTLCRYTEVNHDLNTQLLIIISDLPNPNFASNMLEYFKDGGAKSTCQSQNALPVTPREV